jgi:hypothetical protein
VAGNEAANTLPKNSADFGLVMLVRKPRRNAAAEDTDGPHLPSARPLERQRRLAT